MIPTFYLPTFGDSSLVPVILLKYELQNQNNKHYLTDSAVSAEKYLDRGFDVRTERNEVRAKS